MTRERVPLEKRNVSKARREKIIKAQEGVCKRAHCEAEAVAVDHVIPLWVGGSNRDDNLEGLCQPCHDRKTKAEASARAKVKRIEKRLDGTRKPRKAIPQRKNAWPPKGSHKWPKKKLARPTSSVGMEPLQAAECTKETPNGGRNA
jgi:hypothetical protein